MTSTLLPPRLSPKRSRLWRIGIFLSVITGGVLMVGATVVGVLLYTGSGPTLLRDQIHDFLTNNNLSVNIVGISGNVPFDFTIASLDATLTPSASALPDTMTLKNLHVVWDWVPLLYGKIRLTTLSMDACHIRMAPKNPDDTLRPPLTVPKVFLAVENMHIGQLKVTQSQHQPMILADTISGHGGVTLLKGMWVKLRGNLQAPASADIELTIEGSPITGVEGDVVIHQSPIVKGRVTFMFQPSALGGHGSTLTGKITAAASEEALGILSFLIKPVDISYTITYPQKNAVEWRIVGAQGTLLPLTAQGSVPKNGSAWEATFDLIKKSTHELGKIGPHLMMGTFDKGMLSF